MKKPLLTGLLTILLLTGCSASKPSAAEFDLGVIQTTGSKNKSIISFYTEDFGKVNSLYLPYGSMNYHGFHGPIVLDDHLYVIPKGLSNKKDLGLVLDVDLATGKEEQIKFNRVNITDTVVTSDAVFAVSNVNQTVFLDRYNRKTRTIDTITMPGWIVLVAEAHDGQLIVTGSSMSQGSPAKVSLQKIDFESGSYAQLADLTPYAYESEPPTHTLSHGNQIFMTSNDQLLIYNDEDMTVEAKKLPANMASQMLMDDERIYILHADIVASSRESSLTVVNLKDFTMENYPLKETIWQLTKEGNALYGLDLDDHAVHVFNLNEAGIQKKSTLKLTLDEELKLSAIFVK